MEIEILNPAPTYLKISDIVSEEFAQKLISIVQRKGKTTNYATNPNCREYRIANVMIGSMEKEDILALTALHSIAEPIQNIANEIFKNTALLKIITHAGFWLMEYSEGSEFKEHVDYSLEDDEYSTAALATLCISLSDPEDYEGGELLLSGKTLPQEKLGGYVWDGWTYHQVKPVTKGKRYVLVIHFTGLVKG